SCKTPVPTCRFIITSWTIERAEKSIPLRDIGYDVGQIIVRTNRVWRRTMRAAIVLVVCVCGTIRAEDRPGYTAIWLQFANSADDKTSRAKLVAGGEESRESLIDLLCGAKMRPVDRNAVEKLIPQLGSAGFAEREKAQRALSGMGPAVVPH